MRISHLVKLSSGKCMKLSQPSQDRFQGGAICPKSSHLIASNGIRQNSRRAQECKNMKAKIPPRCNFFTTIFCLSLPHQYTFRLTTNVQRSPTSGKLLSGRAQALRPVSPKVCQKIAAKKMGTSKRQSKDSSLNHLALHSFAPMP